MWNPETVTAFGNEHTYACKLILKSICLTLLEQIFTYRLLGMTFRPNPEDLRMSFVANGTLTMFGTYPKRTEHPPGFELWEARNTRQAAVVSRRVDYPLSHCCPVL